MVSAIGLEIIQWFSAVQDHHLNISSKYGADTLKFGAYRAELEVFQICVKNLQNIQTAPKSSTNGSNRAQQHSYTANHHTRVDYDGWGKLPR